MKHLRVVQINSYSCNRLCAHVHAYSQHRGVSIRACWQNKQELNALCDNHPTYMGFGHFFSKFSSAEDPVRQADIEKVLMRNELRLWARSPPVIVSERNSQKFHECNIYGALDT